MTSAPVNKHRQDQDESALDKMPFDVAHTLARLAWHEGWRASLSRAQKARPDKPPIYEDASKFLDFHKAKLKELREAWNLLGVKWAEGPRGHKDGLEVTSSFQQLAKAAAEHTASMRVYSIAKLKKKKDYEKFMEKQKKEQDEHWETFDKVLNTLKEERSSVVTKFMCDRAAHVIWRACYHSANSVGEKLSEVEEQDELEEEEDYDVDDEGEGEEDDIDDDDDEDEDERFGENYLGSSDDAVQDFSGMLDSLRECFSGDARPAFGVRLDLSSLDSSAAEAELENIAAVPGIFGNKALNAVRFVIPYCPMPKDPLGEVVRSSLVKAKALDLMVHFEILIGPSSGHETWLRSFAQAVASESCVKGVSFPDVTEVRECVGLVGALRKGGLTQGQCAIYLPLPGGAAEDDEGEWTPEYSAVMRGNPADTELSFLLRDGNVMFEAPARFPDDEEVPDLQSMLDGASHIGDSVSGIDLVSALSLKMPALEAPKGKKDNATGPPTDTEFFVEFTQRLIANGLDASMGFFFESWLPLENDSNGETSLKCCLAKGQVDLSADVQVIQPTGGTHKYSLVYLHGFTCDGYGYLLEPEDFYRPKTKKKTKNKKKGGSAKKGEADDDEEEYEPIPGLKCVLPSAPRRKITAYHGEENLAWYDYLVDNDGECEDDQPMEEVEEQTRRIHALLDAEVARVGAKNVFLGGASQGCGMAMHAGMTYPGELGALVGTMGHVLTPTPVTPEWIALGVPVYCYIGLKDSTMPWDKWVKATWDRIEDAGGKLKVVKDDEADHGEHEDQWMRSFLAEILKPSTVKTSSSKKKAGKK